MKLFSLIPGNLTVALTSADPEQALQFICASGITVSRIHRKSDLTFLFSVSANEYATLTHICEKHGYSLKTHSKQGLHWILKCILSRKVLLLGILLLVLFTLFLPTRVFFITVQGNQTIPTNRILSAAQDCGIRFGASRRQVRSEKVKNKLLASLPQLQWVGVNTAGCVATISVRERAQEQPLEKKQVSSIVADRDGYLLSVTVNRGNPLCQPGQYVTAGQLLVSGYTDCGIFIQATASDAEITAQTIRRLEAVRPSESQIRIGQQDIFRKYSLLIGKKRINLWKGSGILDSTCGRIYKEKYASLPGGFQLPIALCVEEYISYDTTAAACSEDAARESLSSFAQAYLRRQMTTGTILFHDEIFTQKDGVFRLSGIYTCQEIIGRIQQETIGE